MTIQQALDLALQHHQAGRLTEAEALYRQVLAAQPANVDARHLLGVAAHQGGRHELAVEWIRQAIAFDPGNAAAHSNLGEAYRLLGRLGEAAAAYRQALALRPNFPEAHNNLGIVLKERGQFEEAIAAYGRAIELKPAYAEAHNNLGNALKEQGRLEEAAAAYRRAIELNPSYPEAHNNLGTTLKDRGEIDAAIAAYRHAIQLKPDYAGARSNLIYTLHFHPGRNAPAITEAQRQWNQEFSEPLKGFLRPHANDRHPERRLRVGYVSPEFRDHVTGRYLLPLFQNHDHRNFEILCYSGILQPDAMTEAFRQRADGGWRSTLGVADEALAAMIRQDGVDILVDLTQHMMGNRLRLFAHQPAPVQVSFAGYPESTGVEAIGYRISDRWLESELGDRRSEIGWKAEPELRFPISNLRAEHVFLIDSFWCYDPCGADVKINELPARESGHVTFGSLNNFCKINEPVLRLWALVLRKVPDARLMMLTWSGSHRRRTLDFLEQEGVAATRVEFAALRAREAYLELYRRLDVALDPFPYGGHTTSLDALWMGVPVVSLAGECAVSRAGLSQLSNLGLPELIAHSEDEYVGIATHLAGDLPRLAELRRSLRARLEASVLMDAPRFARNIEAAYRAMWRHWCGEAPSGLPETGNPP